LSITISFDDCGSRDAQRDLVSLLRYLESCEELDGRIELRSRHGADRLGGLADAIAVAVGSGGAVTALVTMVAAWLERRGSEVTIRLVNERTGRTAEINGLRMRGVDAAEAERVLRSLGDSLGSDDAS
jgi:membrane-associated two-gene conflict system component 1 (EACC1)